MDKSEPPSHIIALTAEITAAYVENNVIGVEALPDLIRAVYGALNGLGVDSKEPSPEEPKPSAYQVRQSLSEGGLISFIDGRTYKTLKRHLGTHGMTPEEYRKRFGLPASYPMGTTAGTTIRNVNGVYLKLMNLRALDPAYLAQGKVGMQAGGKLEKTVWAEYVDRREKLALDAAAIRSAITALAWSTSDAGDALPGYEGDEGGVVIRLHKRYERDRRLVAEKKKAAKAAGPLACEACGFDFAANYGELGADFIEVHHKNPVHFMKAKSKTHLNDLALLCANCHRMAHRKRIPLTVDELKAIMDQTLA